MFVKCGKRFEKIFNMTVDDSTLIINNGNIKIHTSSSLDAADAYQTLIDSYARGVRIVTINEGGAGYENILPY